MGTVFDLKNRVELMDRKIRGYQSDLRHAKVPCALSGTRETDKIFWLESLISAATKEREFPAAQLTEEV